MVRKLLRNDEIVRLLFSFLSFVSQALLTLPVSKMTLYDRRLNFKLLISVSAPCNYSRIDPMLVACLADYTGFLPISSHHERSISTNRNDAEKGKESDRPIYLPFYEAPLSHWVHLDAPPPGPHAVRVRVRRRGLRILLVSGPVFVSTISTYRNWLALFRKALVQVSFAGVERI